MKLNRTTFFLLAVLCPLKIFAAVISGSITSAEKEPLPFVSVYIPGTTTGTTANSEGRYAIDLPPGYYRLAFRLIGYASHEENITVASAALTLDVQLSGESYRLKEFTVNSDAEDPAYAIIRNAIRKRKFYRNQVEKYSCDAYVKSTQRLDDAPEKFLGQKVDLSEQMDSATKMFYLSESVSHLYFHQPDKYREEMISSKVSGSPKTYSFNQAQDVLISFYDNLISIGGLTPRGIISPISSNALFSYRYRLEGTFTENGVEINKIAVIPKRTTDPVFSGTIYIAEDSWRIHSLDLFITRDQQMEFVDTFRIRESFIAVNKDVSLPFSHQLSYIFSAFGFKGNGIVLGIFNNYNIAPLFNSSYFGGEVLKVNDDANKKDSAYWASTRPVPLTGDEGSDYHRRDSTRIIHESKEWLDSLDKKNNKLTPAFLISGYSWDRSFKHRHYSIGSPLQNINFNTVEGWNMKMNLVYRKTYGDQDSREFSVLPSARYGFSNRHFNGHVAVDYRYDPRKHASWSADAGSDIRQYNRRDPISPFINSLYSLLAKKNYMKLFEQRFIAVNHRSEITNGLSWNINAEYSQRNVLGNTSDYSFVKKISREYTSNLPVVPASDIVNFPQHEALILEVRTAIRFGMKYIDRPDVKYNLGSDYPAIRLSYKKGIYTAGSDVDFDFFRASVEDEMHFGLLGKLNYLVTFSEFLSSRRLFFPDYIHFNGNKTWYSNFAIDEYKNLEYYAYSTSRWAFEAHGEQNFGGFILNKIPLLRRLKLQEIAGIHYLRTKTLNQYLEASLGVEKLNLFRIDVFTSFPGGKRGNIGFVFGIKRVF